MESLKMLALKAAFRSLDNDTKIQFCKDMLDIRACDNKTLIQSCDKCKGILYSRPGQDRLGTCQKCGDITCSKCEGLTPVGTIRGRVMPNRVFAAHKRKIQFMCKDCRGHPPYTMFVDTRTNHKYNIYHNEFSTMYELVK